MGEERDDLWAAVQHERRQLCEQLAQVPPEAWEEPSPCPGWSVHDVVAHLVDSALTTRLGFVWGLARAGFDFDRQNARGVERARGAAPAETLERLRAVVDRRTAPPAPLATRLVEAFVHGEDVRRPLGLPATTRRPPSLGRSASRCVRARVSAVRGSTWPVCGSRRTTWTWCWGRGRR